MLKTCVRIFVIAFIVLPVFAANAAALINLYGNPDLYELMNQQDGFGLKYLSVFDVLPALSTLFYLAHRFAKSKGSRSQGVLSVLAWVSIAPTLCVIALFIIIILGGGAAGVAYQ